MIPVLFASNATEFSSQGLGALSDAISCFVEEERNGSYELEMEYPYEGQHFNEIALRSIIKAVPSPHRAAQPFRVYDISKPIDGKVSVKARHISYDLSGIPVKPFRVDSGTAINILQTMLTNSAVTNPFTVYSDISESGKLEVDEPTSFRSLLGDDTNSLLATFENAEFEFDNYQIKLLAHRGTDRGCIFEYGKNMVTMDHEASSESTITGILPYWKGSAGEDGVPPIVMMDEPVLKPDGAPEYDIIAVSDFSEYFDEAPTSAELRVAAEEYLTTVDIGQIETHLKVSFVQLGGLDICDLCDIVTVRHSKLGIDVSEEITKIRTNVLTEQYDSIEIGEPKSSISDRLASIKKIEEKIPTSRDMSDLAHDIVDTVVGVDGGYFFLEYNDEEHPNQPTGWCIMDTPTIAESTDGHNCWRFTEGGMAHSSHGYGGPYDDVAIDMNGRILANELLLANGLKATAFIQASVDEDGVASMQLGSDTNPYVLKLESDRVSIYQGDTPTTYWTNSSFVLNTLKEFVLGDVKIVAQSNGSISIIAK